MASRGIKDRVAIIGMGCTRFGEHWDKGADDLLAEGDAAMQATKLPEAEAAYLEAIKLAPNDPRTHIAVSRSSCRHAR